WSTLVRRPVKKLSRQMTSLPSVARRSHKCEPRKPAPPVTRIRFAILASPSPSRHEPVTLELRHRTVHLVVGSLRSHPRDEIHHPVFEPNPRTHAEHALEESRVRGAVANVARSELTGDLRPPRDSDRSAQELAEA